MKIIFLIILQILFLNECLGQNTILWSVSDSISGNQSYLVGTFHAYGNSFVDSIPQIKKALEKSDLAIFENIASENDRIQFFEKRESKNSWWKNLNKKDLQQLKNYAEQWKYPLDKLTMIETIILLERDYSTLVCKTKKSSDKWSNMDNYLTSMAIKLEKEIIGLETFAEQTEIIQKAFGHIKKRELKEQLLNKLLGLQTKNTESVDCDAENNFRKMDLDYSFDIDCPNDILIKKRNEDWMKIIPGLLKDKNCFLVVGYEHLKYNCGLIQSLKEEGFVIEPIIFENLHTAEF
ncbi:Uncharacterized conserved protein YbaP, TraB family [Robiginitalea myxolifaciens]|uniref:Uncharacterized conserved protein YbaP, TraB family n=1 Tax=Robiginitalea myxolifaciens TaxID=400055 RepID=A0A1I6HLL7_9FLAO|nr:TraB/GumN family protein [Robiginitalea myxolifaciens]SFR55326.1 Uncharacterized conserved protein YbaP, TraB family [Robiginitalea myxolifaciens]